MRRGLLAASAAALAFALLAGGGVFFMMKQGGGPASYAGAAARTVQVFEGEDSVAAIALGPSGPALTVLRPGEAAQTAQRAVEELKLRSSLPLILEEGGTAGVVEARTDDPRFAHAAAGFLRARYGLDARADEPR